MCHFSHPAQSELWIFVYSQDFIDIRAKQLTEAFHAAPLPLFLSLRAVCAIPTQLGFGTIALPSQPGQGQQTTPWLLCPWEQTLVPVSACILLRSQVKMHQQRPLEQANKTARVLQLPAGIFPCGRRGPSVKSQGWSSAGSEGEGRLRLGVLKAVLDTAASPTLTQTL